MKRLTDTQIEMQRVSDWYALHGQDCCSSLNGYAVSDHRYRYSMGFGDAWSVKRVLPANYRYTYSADTIGGTTYEYGCDAPRYPVPALRGWNYLSPPNDGGVKNDCVMIGATYVDWSRGSIEIL